MGRLPLLSKISRFHMRILRLLVVVLVWVHWDACLNYGACVYQHPPRWVMPGIPRNCYCGEGAESASSWLVFAGSAGWMRTAWRSSPSEKSMRGLC